MTLLDEIRIAQRNAGEAAVIANLERMGLVKPRPNPQRDLLGRCLSVISTPEGDCSTEQSAVDLNSKAQRVRSDIAIKSIAACAVNTGAM